MASIREIDRYFEFAKDLTLEAGKIIKSAYGRKKNVQTKGTEWDLVTEYDIRIEDVLIRKLRQEFPEHKFIAEETLGTEKNIPELTDAPTWLIDPIDGTVNFVHSFSQSCISVALAIGKELVIGIILNPAKDELYTAKRGEGAFYNGEHIQTSDVTELRKSLVMLNTDIKRDRSAHYDIDIGRFEALTNEVQGVRCVGSAALSLAYVAAGVIDVFQMDYLKPWDMAAGVLMVREAGGVVMGSRGGEFDMMHPGTLAAANEKLAGETANLIVKTDLKVQRGRLRRS